MKKFRFIPFLALSLMLASCSEESEQPKNETASETAEEDNSELENLEKENEELKRKKLEEENAALKKELEEGKEADDSESKPETETADANSDKESVKEKTSNESETKESAPGKSAVIFDINSEEVQSQLFGTTTGNEDGTFAQDVITNGMTQTEVEEKYGPYDFTFYAGGASPAFHGNLAVVYSQRTPYGPGNDGSDSSINPDENYVEHVWYFAHVTAEELLSAMGEPDNYNAGDQSMNGLPYYIYDGYGEDGRYYTTGASTFNTPDGERVGLIKRSVFDEDPSEQNSADSDERYFDDYYTAGYPVELTKEKDDFTYETLSGFIFKRYLPGLANYYNDENDDVMFLLEGNALQMIQANKSSGNFANYKNYPGTTVSAQQISEREYQITVNRTYSHATSNGEATSQVTYKVLDTDGMLKVIDYK